MGKIGRTVVAIWNFYIDGFKNMTWGRPLWGLIILKVIILFAILRVFFFRPAMAGMSDEQKSEQVGNHLSTQDRNSQENTDKNIHILNLTTD